MAYLYDDDSQGYFDNSLRKIAKDKNYQVGYDQATGSVIVTNPATNKSISFKSGQGQEYGLGGLKDGNNVVSDISKLDAALGNTSSTISAPSSQPVKNYFETAVNKSISPYREKTNELLSSIMDSINSNKTSDYRNKIDTALTDLQSKMVTQNAPYDPANDVLYQTYKNQMLGDATKAYNDMMAEYLSNQGGNFNSAATQIASAAKNDLLNKANAAMSDFANQYYSRGQQALQNQYNLINALSNLENTDYTRNRQQVQDNMSIVNTLLGIDNTDYARNYNEIQDYIKNTGYIPIDTSTIPADSPLRKIDDYSAEIEKRMAANPNDPTIPVLQALRNEKIDSWKTTNPTLYEQYKNTITPVAGIPTMQKQANDLEIESQRIANQINSLKLMALPKQLQNELELAEVQLQQARELAKLEPEKARAQINQIQATIDNMYADNARANEQLQLQKDELQLKKDEAKAAKDKKESQDEIDKRAIANAIAQGDNVVNWFNENASALANDISADALDKIRLLVNSAMSRQNKNNGSNNIEWQTNN